jgi:hypothetical protein
MKNIATGIQARGGLVVGKVVFSKGDGVSDIMNNRFKQD